MKKLIISLVSIGFIAYFLTGCGGEKTPGQKSAEAWLTITDDLGKTIRLENEPGEVISLAPNLTEIIYSLGAGDKLSGNTLYCNYPDEADSVEKVGDLISVNFEKIIQLNPGLIFMTIEGNTKGVYEKLTQAGFNVFISDPRSFEGIKKSAKDIGRILGRSNAADSLINKWEKDVASISSKVSGEPGKSALFLVSLQPIMAAGENTFINEFVRILNLTNAAAGTGMNYPVLNREELLTRNPDFIIYNDMEAGNSGIGETYPEWAQLEAVKKGNIILIDPDLLFRPGPRFTVALEKLYEAIYLRD